MCSKNQDVLHVSRIWIFKYSDLEFENSKSWRVDEEFWWKYQNCLFRSIEMKILIFWIFEVLEMSWRPRYSRSSSLTYHKNPNLGFPSSNETKINCFWINLLWLIIMTQNHVLLRIIPRFHSENPGRLLKVIENWYMIGLEIKTDRSTTKFHGFYNKTNSEKFQNSQNFKFQLVIVIFKWKS